MAARSSRGGAQAGRPEPIKARHPPSDGAALSIAVLPNPPPG